MKTITFLLLNLFISLSSFSQVINYIEYFFDSDPGLGQATPIEFTSYTQVDQTFTADVSTLENGIHRLFVRAKDSTGKWSILSSRLFNVIETTEHTSATQIIAIEYFIDTDPGLGNGVQVDLSSGADITIQFDSELNSIPNGIHRLFVRAKDNNNNWSILGSRLFNVQSEPEQIASTINSINWTVSGYGITPFSESKIISVPLSELTENIFPNISGLTNGDYTLSVTAVDNNGVTSLPEIKNFGVIAPPENKKSAQFDGSSDRIRVTDSAPINPNANPAAYKISGSSLSVEAWVYATSLPGSGKGEVILGRSASGAFGADPYFSYALKLDNYSNGNPAFNFTVSNGNAGSALYAVADSVPVQTGKWYHIAGTYDGNNVKIYINGELKKQISSNGLSIGTGGVGFYIGGTVSEYFTGLIDEVRLWNVTRSQSEISGNRSKTLFGNETGLAGYWQLDSTYVNGTNTITPDLTSNKNDLAVQFDTKLISFPAESEVKIVPTSVIVSNLYNYSSGKWSAKVYGNGWPLPSISVNSIPANMTLEGDSLKWSVPSDAFGVYNLDLKAANSGGSVDFINNLYIDNFHQTANEIKLDVAARGKVGAFSSFGKGMMYKNLNGLAGGDFSLVDRNSGKYAGGLYSTQNSFRVLKIFENTQSQLPGFTGTRSVMDDSYEQNPIHVKVLQTVHTKSTSPDGKYSILEYKVINTSGSNIDDLFAQFTTDFDFANGAKGNYDDSKQLSYTYDATVQNPYYFGLQLLNKNASGASIFYNGGDTAFVRKSGKLTTFSNNAQTPGDLRNQISAGPFNLSANETLTVAFALLAGDDLSSLEQSAAFAKQAYNQSLNINSGAGYFAFPNDRARVNTGSNINPNADQTVLSDFTQNGITVEGWVFATTLPKPNSEQVIVSRPIAAGNPFQTYSLRFANYNQEHYPTLEFIISDGVTPDHWGYAGITVDESYIGKWIHVAGTYDGSTVRLFIDGVMKGSNGFDKAIGTNGQGIYIGGSTNYGWSYSVIDEVRLWNYARTQTEIASTMNYSLNGNEPGLIGYWPLNETYQTTANGVSLTATSDLSPYRNDLQVLGLTQIVDDVAGSDVKIKPLHLRLSDNYVMTGFPYKQKFIFDGWPKPTVNLSNPLNGFDYISGSGYDADSLFWNPNESFWGEYYLISTLTNSEGSSSDSTFMYIAFTKQVSANTQSLLFSTEGRFSAGGRYGRGLVYKGKNGLFDGNFGVVVKSENKVSGGLYSAAEFTDNFGIKTVTPKISGFDQAYEIKYTDLNSRNKKPIGVEIIQTVLQKSSAPNDHFTIVEFSIKNKSGKTLNDVYAELAADFDIGNVTNNLGGFDSQNKLSYAYEVGGVNNSAYYGMTLLDEEVSGHSNSLSGIGFDDGNALLVADSIFADPSIAQDVRNGLFAGPFNLNNNDSVVVAFAFVAADDLNGLKMAASAAKTAYQPIAVSVESAVEIPKEFSVSQNYPNPFNPSTKIIYSVPRSADIQISVFDLMGREIAVLENSRKEVGAYSTIWNSKNISGQTVSSGIYFYRIVAKTEKGIEFVKTNKMLLVK